MKKLVLILFYTLLLAGPPMKSSDPFVPEKGQFEINIAVSGEHTDDRLFRAPILDFNYGIVENVQITFETAYVSSEVESDFDSFELALKWHFYESELFSIALYPKYKLYPIDSIFNNGETFELSVPLNVALTQNLDLVLDSVYILPKEGVNHFEFGSYLKYKMDKHSLYTELFVENINNKDEDVFTLGIVGYSYQFHDNIAFMISFGKEITSQNQATVGYSGLQFVF